MKKPVLSVVINTKNVASTLKSTLDSIKPIADEIIVADMHSQDETVRIARQYTDQIFQVDDYQFVEPARNFALAKATGDWILVIDADEELPLSLREFIAKVVAQDVSQDLQADCYFLPRQNIIFGQWIEKTGWWPDYQLRFFRRGYVEWSDQIHAAPRIKNGRVMKLPSTKEYALIHHNYATVHEFVTRLNRYTDIQSQQDQPTEPAGAQVVDNSVGKKSVVSVTAVTVTQVFFTEFLRRCFAEKGIDEGIRGVGLSYLQGLSEVARLLKIWEKQRATQMAEEADPRLVIKELQTFHRQLAYWLADWQCQHSRGIIRLWWQVRRKLQV